MCRRCWLRAGQHLHQLFLGRVGVFFIESSMGLREMSQCPEKDLTTAFSLHQLVLSQLRIYQDTSAGAVKFREVPLTPLGSPLRSALVHCIINIRIGEAVRPGPAAARGHWVEVASIQSAVSLPSPAPGDGGGGLLGWTPVTGDSTVTTAPSRDTTRHSGNSVNLEE